MQGIMQGGHLDGLDKVRHKNISIHANISENMILTMNYQFMSITTNKRSIRIQIYTHIRCGMSNIKISNIAAGLQLQLCLKRRG